MDQIEAKGEDWGEAQTETPEVTRGPKPAGLSKQKADKEPRVLSKGAPGDDRTAADTIGQVAYADGQRKSTGGAGEPEKSPLEPEKQGGIGGP